MTKSKLLASFLSILLLFSLFPVTHGSANENNVKTDYLKVVYNDKILWHEPVEQGTKIQVIQDGEVLISEIFQRENILDLDTPVIPEGKMMSYWDITYTPHYKEDEEDEEDENKESKYEKGTFVVEPVFVEAREISITFNALEGGDIVHNNSQTKQLVKGVDEGTTLEKVLPKVNPMTNNKFSGWYTKENDEFVKIENDEILKEDIELYARFFPDINENDIDDRTEKIHIKFVTNVKKEPVVEKDIHVGQGFELPKLKKNNHIFIGWFYDDKFSNLYSGEPLKENTVLYAKWEQFEEVVNKEEPITDKDISDQIEAILNEKLKDQNKPIPTPPKEETPNNSPSPNITINPDPNKSGEILGKNEDFNNDVTVGGINGIAEHEKNYVFKNNNVGQRYMIKFYDLDNDFLFSITLPYGRTVEVVNSKGTKIKEYAIRQDTTINLNVNQFYNPNEEDLLGFDSNTKTRNSSDITTIYPDVRFIETDQLAMQDEEVVDTQSKLKIVFAIGIALLLIISFITFLLIKKNKKENLGGM